MKIIKVKYIIPLLISAFVFLSPISKAHALVPIPDIAPSVQNPKIKVDPDILTVKPWNIRCTVYENLVDKKIEKINEQEEKHYKKYIGLSKDLEDFIEERESEGYDMSEIKKDLETLNGKIDKYNQNHDIYLEKLMNIKNNICTHTEDEYKNSIKAAKDALKEVRKDVVDIKTYYYTDIRPDILEFKQQLISEEE